MKSSVSLKYNNLSGQKAFIIFLLLILNVIQGTAQHDVDKYEQYSKVYNVNIKDDSIADYMTGLKTKLENAIEEKEDFQIAENSLFLGLMYLRLNSYDIATDYYLTALNHFKLIKDTTYIIHTLRALSFVNSLVNNDSIALRYSLENLHYCESVKDSFLLEKNYINLGICYSKLDDEVTAIKYFNKAVEFGERLNDTVLLQRIYYNIGSYYEKSKDYTRAEHFYYKGLNIEKGKDKQIIANIYSSLSMIALNRGNYEKALTNIKKALEIAESYGGYKDQETFYKTYISILIKMGKTKNLLTVFDKYSEIQNKGFNADKAEQIAKMKILYELDQFESEIELLTAKNKLNQSKLRASKNRLIIAGVVIFLVMIILVSTAIQYFRIKKSHKKIVEENIKLIKAEEKNTELQKIILNENLSGISLATDSHPVNSSRETQNEEAKNIEELFLQVKSLLETEKLYTNPDISIGTLAKKLNSNRTYLSKAINTVSGKTFIEFINEYRIAEAKRILYSKESDFITIEAIGNKAGFNSKATFFRVFKSVAGVTPNYFQKNARKYSFH